MCYDTKCRLILQWAKTTTFDPATVASIYDWGMEHGYSYAQEQAIDNIYTKWKVAQWAKKKGLI